MSTFAAPIEVINVALLVAGASTVTENDGSRAWQVANGVYEPLVKARLTKHRWSWAQAEKTLVRTSTNTGKYKYGYALPADRLTVHDAHCAGTKARYQLFGDEARFEIDRTDLVIAYTKRVTEGQWDADFADAMVKDLEGIFLSALFEDRIRGRETREMATSMFELAMLRDKNAGTQLQKTEDPVIVGAWKGNRHAQGS